MSALLGRIKISPSQITGITGIGESLLRIPVPSADGLIFIAADGSANWFFVFSQARQFLTSFTDPGIPGGFPLVDETGDVLSWIPAGVTQTQTPVTSLTFNSGICTTAS